jgi:VWFA-related protein
VSNAALFFPLVCSFIASAFPQAGPQSEAYVPVTRLDLAVVGYQELSAMARRSGAANLSLDFLDNDHVLFTFNPKKLFERLPDCPPTHNDRLVHAAVFEVSSGKVLYERDWYLHDSRRYLWSLGSGRVLLRRLNSLYAVDAELHEKLLLTSPRDVLWMSITPDGKQIILETADDPPAQNTKARPAPKTRIRIEFLDVDSLRVQRIIKAEKPVNLEGTSSGFASVTPGLSGKVWLVRFGSSEQQRANVARVRSKRAPDVLYLSSNTLLIGRDSVSAPGYSVSALTVTGNRLWRQHWEAHRYASVIASSEDGSRFAISTLRLIDVPKPDIEDNEPGSDQEGLEQRIQVLDTASGDPVLSVAVTPVVLSGQNFSLAPDGLRLVLLHGTTLEFYDLPQMSPDERARYTAVRADVPGLYVPPAEAKSTDTDNEPVFTAADQPQSVAADEPSSNPNGQAQDNAAVTEQPPATQAGGGGVPAVPTVPTMMAGQPSTSSMPAFRSHAQVVALDVVVADPKGHSIKGLPRQGFVIKEDGRAQAITYFDEVTGSKPSTEPMPAIEKKEPAPNVFTNESPIPDSSSVTLILYDLLNTPAVEQQRAKLELLKFLQNKPKESRFALCVLSEKLQMIQGFTPDETLLVKATRAQKGSLRYSSMLSQDAQSQQAVDWLTQGSMRLMATSGKFATAATSMLDTAGKFEQEESQRRARDLETRMWVTMDAFTQLARYLSAIPGRKSLIWLSGSFPLGIFPGVDLRNPSSETNGYSDQVKQAVNLLAESHIALYPVDVRGLSAYSIQTPSFSNGTDSTQPLALSQSPFVPSSDTKRFNELGNLSSAGNIGANLPGGDTPFMEQITEHGIMDQIAGHTGGKAFYNTNGIEQAMAVAMEQETNYYALSYVPSNKKYDGKFRKIKVSLTPEEKKLHLIHRSGYFAVDPDASGASKDAATGFGLAAMQHGSPQSHQVLFAVRVVPIGKPRKVDAASAGQAPAGSKKKKSQAKAPPEPVEVQHYAIDYAVTPAQLRFDATPEGFHRGVINFMVTSFDDDGTLRTSMASRATSNLKPESYQEVATGGLRLHQEVDVPVKAGSLRMGVQDALSGRMGTIEIALPVKALPGVEQGSRNSMPEIEPD